jgi:hypothetical protein
VILAAAWLAARPSRAGARLEGLHGLLLGDDPHARAAVRFADDQPLVLEPEEGRSHRRPRQVERAAHVGLHEPLIRHELAPQDRLAEPEVTGVVARAWSRVHVVRTGVGAGGGGNRADARPAAIVVKIGAKIANELVEQRLPEAFRPQRLALPAIGLAVVCAVALVVLPFDFRQALINSLIATVMALSLVVITGFVGQISVVQLALAGVAGFTVSHLAVDAGIGFPLAPLAGAAAAVVLVELTAVSARSGSGAWGSRS